MTHLCDIVAKEQKEQEALMNTSEFVEARDMLIWSVGMICFLIVFLLLNRRKVRELRRELYPHIDPSLPTPLEMYVSSRNVALLVFAVSLCVALVGAYQMWRLAS